MTQNTLDTANDKSDSLDKLLSVMADPEIQAATIEVLTKMPTMAKMMSLMELTADLVGPLASDDELVQMAIGGVSKARSSFDADTFKAAGLIMNKLPFLVKTIEMAELAADLLGPLLTDEEFVAEMIKNAKTIAKPFNRETLRAGMYVVEKMPLVVQLASILEIFEDVIQPLADQPEFVREVREKADSDTRTVSAFKLLQLRKNTEVQSILRRLITLLDVLHEAQPTVQRNGQ